MSTDTEHSVSYQTIFYVLMAALFVSLAIGHLADGNVWANGVIFVIAFAKAYLVASYFMHLSVEPRFIKVLVVALMTVLAIFFVGLVPDVVWVFGGG